jgi:hypothetical protein
MLKPKYLWALAGIPIGYLLILAVHVTPVISEASSYMAEVRGTSEKKIDSAKFAKKIDRVVADLSVPVVKQILGAAGVNLSAIRPEIRAVVTAGPTLAGANKPQKYLVSFQNSAEARGTGGILGAFAIVEMNKGDFKILRTGSNAALYSMNISTLPIPMPDEFLKLYGNNPGILQNSNLSPHFPYGAEIWMGLWKKKFGENLDGVIAVDPSALSYILKSTGPITLPNGEKITAENVVSETLEKAYKRFEKDNKARKDYLVQILDAAAAKVISLEFDKRKMLTGITRGVIENRILIYSKDDAAEKTLSTTRVAGFLTTEPNNEFRTVIQNIDASKLDYYLDRNVVVESKVCKDVRETQVRITVKNALKSGAGLPAYVLTRADKGKPANLVTGAHRFKVFIYGPTESRLVSASRENRTANLGGGATERSRPVYVADVDLSPGQSEELQANFAGGVGKITYVDQPLVRPTKIVIKDKC